MGSIPVPQVKPSRIDLYIIITQADMPRYNAVIATYVTKFRSRSTSRVSSFHVVEMKINRSRGCLKSRSHDEHFDTF